MNTTMLSVKLARECEASGGDATHIVMFGYWNVGRRQIQMYNEQNAQLK